VDGEASNLRPTHNGERDDEAAVRPANLDVVWREQRGEYTRETSHLKTPSRGDGLGATRRAASRQRVGQRSLVDVPDARAARGSASTPQPGPPRRRRARRVHAARDSGREQRQLAVGGAGRRTNPREAALPEREQGPCDGVEVRRPRRHPRSRRAKSSPTTSRTRLFVGDFEMKIGQPRTFAGHLLLPCFARGALRARSRARSGGERRRW